MSYIDKEKQKEYQRKWMANRRLEWLQKNGPCKNCGSWENLEVDHVDESKKLNHRVWSWSYPRRMQELEKCQVLCSKHHKEKTLSEREKTQHGKLWMYTRYKCRCSLCILAKKIDNDKRRGKA